MFRTQLRFCLAVLLFAPWASRQAAGQEITFGIKSFDEVLSSFKTLAPPDQFAAFEDMINKVTGGKGFIGIDAGRPLVGFVTLPENPIAGDPPKLLFAAPVADRKQIAELLKTLKYEIDETEGGIYRGGGGCARLAGKHLWFAERAEWLTGKLPDPAKVTAPAAVPGALMWATMRLDQAPKAYKAVFAQLLDAEVAKNAEKMPGESDGDWKGRRLGSRMAADAMKAALESGREFTVAFEMDRVGRKAAFDVSLTPQAGSRLAESLAAWGKAGAGFGSLCRQPSPMSVALKFALADELRSYFAEQFWTGFNAGKPVDAAKAAKAKQIAEQLGAAIDADAFDAGFALDKSPDGKPVGKFAMRIKDGRKLDKAFRDAMAELPAGSGKVVLDEARHRGVAIHSIQDSNPLESPAKELFGEKPFICVAFRDDAAFVTLGESAQASIKELLEMPAAPAAGTPLFEMTLLFSQLAPMLTGGDAQTRAFAELFRNLSDEDKRHSEMRIVVRAGESFRVRWELGEAFFRLGRQLGN